MISPLYTEKIHVRNLKIILDVEDIWNECPAAIPKNKPKSKGFHNEIVYNCSNDSTHPCKICMGFVGLDINLDGKNCPCHFYGVETAIFMTLEALKSKGYMANA
jgi:hypothetical protein